MPRQRSGVLHVVGDQAVFRIHLEPFPRSNVTTYVVARLDATEPAADLAYLCRHEEVRGNDAQT